jgi:hypothetical protein
MVQEETKETVKQIFTDYLEGISILSPFTYS